MLRSQIYSLLFLLSCTASAWITLSSDNRSVSPTFRKDTTAKWRYQGSFSCSSITSGTSGKSSPIDPGILTEICSQSSYISAEDLEQDFSVNPLYNRPLTTSSSLKDISDLLNSEQGSTRSDSKLIPNHGSLTYKRSVAKFLYQCFCCRVSSESTDQNYTLHESRHKSSDFN